jgi:hypothetical protein
MLSMHSLLQRTRTLLVACFVLVCIGWFVGEASQALLRWHAQRLLADIRTLNAGHSTWADAQPILKKWSDWSTTKPACTAEACTVQIDLVQTLPSVITGTPGEAARNWLPRLIDRTGLRSVAARAGIVVEHGIVTSRWFGEQVTPPVRDWSAIDNYVPYLSVSSAESSHFREMTEGQALLHANRFVQHKDFYTAVTFSPEENSAEQSALMDFRFNCITRFQPCESQADILPEALRMLQERQLTVVPAR